MFSGLFFLGFFLCLQPLQLLFSTWSKIRTFSLSPSIPFPSPNESGSHSFSYTPIIFFPAFFLGPPARKFLPFSFFYSNRGLITFLIFPLSLSIFSLLACFTFPSVSGAHFLSFFICVFLFFFQASAWLLSASVIMSPYWNAPLSTFNQKSIYSRL